MNIDPKNFIKNLTGDNEEYMQKANEIWSMLDDMSQNDPNSYKKFIESQFEKNKEEVKKKREEELKKTTEELGEGKGKFIFRLKFAILLKEQELKKNNEIGVENKFLIGDEEEGEQERKNWPEEGEIFLNIFEHNKYFFH